ncbi:hypothetical protein GCM10027610_056590 [Dactylosporangium cerinum]
MRDIGPGDERVRTRIGAVPAQPGRPVEVTVRLGAVVGEGVAAIECAVLCLLTHDRRLQAVRPDLRVEGGDGRAGVVGHRAALGWILGGVRVLPVVGHVLVEDDVVGRVRLPVRAGALQVHRDIRDGRLVVLVRLEPRVELVARRREVGDADDLADRSRWIVVLAEVDRGAVALGEELVGQQAAALVGGNARIGRNSGRNHRAGRRHRARVLVVR